MNCKKNKIVREIIELMALFLIGFMFFMWGVLGDDVSEILLLFAIYWGSTAIVKLISVKIKQTDSVKKKVGISVVVIVVLTVLTYGVAFCRPEIAEAYRSNFIWPIVFAVLRITIHEIL